jgi:primosomal replication protein N
MVSLNSDLLRQVKLYVPIRKKTLPRVQVKTALLAVGVVVKIYWLLAQQKEPSNIVVLMLAIL